MIRERSAGPRMISRLEHKSLLVRGSVCLCFVQSLPYTTIYKEATCFEGLHFSIFGSQSFRVMCSIRAKLFFIHTDSIHSGSLMFHMHYSASVKSVCLCASACIGTMHVHARSEGMHVYARIPSFACFCICLLVSRAEQVSACCWLISRHEYVSAFVGLHLELSVCLHVARGLSICWHISRAERVSSFIFLCRELCVYLHLVSCVERWECVCMCLKCVHVSAHIEGFVCFFIHLPASRVERVCACVCTSRAERVSACLCAFWELGMS